MTLRHAGLILACVVLLSGCTRAASATPTGEAPLEEQLREMGRLLYTLSSLNVMNGISLTRPQAEKLRRLASEVRDEADAPLSLNGRLSPQLQWVRDAYVTLRDALLDQKPVDDALRQRIIRARAAEAIAIRTTLGWESLHPYGDCARCHQVRATPTRWNGHSRQEAGYAHFAAALGRRGLHALLDRVDAVETTLTDNQKALFEDFSCCILPPDDLGNPVRIGQVGTAGWQLKLLEHVRATSADRWPQTRDRIVQKLGGAQRLRNPGATEEEVEQVRERVRAVFEEARSLSDADFALQKESLCERLAGPRPHHDTRTQRLARAFFLLHPGTVELYDALLKRRFFR